MMYFFRYFFAVFIRRPKFSQR